MLKKTYKITFDLKEGYDIDGKVHSLEEVAGIIATWMDERIKKRKPVISCFLQEGQLIYPTVGEDSIKRPVTLTPSAVLIGELSTKEDLERTDKEIKATLENLGKTIKKDLGQESVYIIYQEENWCI